MSVQEAKVAPIGNTPLEPGVLEKTKLNKTDIVSALKSSFTYCDSAFSSVSDSALTDMVPFGPNRSASKAFVLNLALLHAGEHYAALAPYLRSRGIVPPSTERMSKR